ncbi:AraC family transcriptional regulator [Naumannella cuiyingiana]|uniref:AraC-like DNA-binding protein n=1 Tax=Naumannella cuiyingiana TaxID=1347891 RepID=A0A7Z0D7Z5_9ACTN|nr:AraC family transcriptional regulator [Naumannella cuiyingiana]NYI70615.1 AraC-like DNA-binding protein [Naumannella cuiyingiana]
MIRAAALRGLPALVDELGADGAALARRHGVPPELLEVAGPPTHGSELIRADDAAALIEAGAEATGRSDFGLTLAERHGPEMLGPLALVLENSSTLDEALELASRYLFIHSPAIRVFLVADHDEGSAVAGLRYESERAGPQGCEFGVGVFHRIVLALAGGPYGLVSVHLPHPPQSSRQRYRDFFGAEVSFNRPASVLWVPNGLGASAPTGGDSRLRHLALAHLEATFGPAEPRVGDQVRLVIEGALGSSLIRLEAVAATLGMHPRTLQRRLAREGLRFADLVDEVRRDNALDLIRRTDLQFRQIADLVGLSEPAALTRLVRRWTGRNPSAVRRSTTAPGVGSAHP